MIMMFTLARALVSFIQSWHDTVVEASFDDRASLSLSDSDARAIIIPGNAPVTGRGTLSLLSIVLITKLRLLGGGHAHWQGRLQHNSEATSDHGFRVNQLGDTESEARKGE